MNAQDLIHRAYAAFNARDIPTVLNTFHPQVRWAKAWEGDYATGHEEVQAYWLRQWQDINPKVVPTSFLEIADGQIEVDVHQVVKDMQGQLIFDGMVKHLINIEDGLLKQMDVVRL